VQEGKQRSSLLEARSSVTQLQPATCVQAGTVAESSVTHPADSFNASLRLNDWMMLPLLLWSLQLALQPKKYVIMCIVMHCCCMLGCMSCTFAVSKCQHAHSFPFVASQIDKVDMLPNKSLRTPLAAGQTALTKEQARMLLVC
jgi:hypothetical protein